MLSGHGLQAQARAQCSLLQTVLQALQTAPASAALPQEQTVAVAAHRVSAGGQRRPDLVREESGKGVGGVREYALQLRSQGRGDVRGECLRPCSGWDSVFTP